MEVILTILAWALFVMVCLLCLPIEARAKLDLCEELAAGVRVRWAFGLLSLEFDTSRGAVVRVFGWSKAVHGSRSRKRRESKREESKRKKRKSPASKRPSGADVARQMLADRHEWLDILRRVIRTLHLRGLVTGTVGLGDPADTALLATLLNVLPDLNGPRCHFNVGVDYLEEELALVGNVSCLLVPLEILIVLFGQLFRAPVRALILLRIRACTKPTRAVVGI